MWDFQDTKYGLELETEQFYILFGNKNLEYSHIQGFLKNRLRNTKLGCQSIHQIHGDGIVQVKAIKREEPQADASFTCQKNIALIIKTADCLPILGYDPKHKYIFAVHAGWRGVCSKILQKCIIRMEKEFGKTQPHLFFGPYIRKKSFVVRTDVLDKIKNEYPLTADVHYNVVSEDQFQLDLYGPIREEFLNSNYPSNHFWDSGKDTCSNVEYNSHRRDRHKAGRNYSIIILKDN